MSRAIKPVEVKIPVPTTLLTSTQVAVNPLIRRELPGESVCLEGPSVKFLSNEKPLCHLSDSHGKRSPARHQCKTKLTLHSRQLLSRISICIKVISNILYRASIPSCHARHSQSGIHLGSVSDGSPLTTGGDDWSPVVMPNSFYHPGNESHLRTVEDSKFLHCQTGFITMVT